MGNCCGVGDENVANSRAIAKELQKNKADDKRLIKLLFLGAGGSGKSTLFKQLKSIHGQGMDVKDLTTYKDIVYHNCVEGMKTLIDKSNELSEDPQYENLRINPSLTNTANEFEKLRNDVDVNEEIAASIKQLWADPGIKNTFEKRSLFQIPDSAKHFFDNIDRIATKGYIPSPEDVLLARARTTGIVEQEFEVNTDHGAHLFKVVDVGGQRNERKKWIHCFENVTAVIFVAALSAYDQVLWEDENQNRMHEALNLFRDICTSRWFSKTSLILFLNKEDLFDEKIQKVDLSCCFENYKGGSPRAAKEFIRDQFLAKGSKQPDDRGGPEQEEEREIYCHYTTAVQKNLVKKVFGDVQHTVIQHSLKIAGLV